MKCAVPSCKNKSREMHHIYPVAWGGPKDGPQIPLCPTHHDFIHESSRKIKKNGMLLENIEDETLRKLTLAILQQWEVFDQTGHAPEARRRIVAELTKQEQKAAHFLKIAGGYSSLESMLKTLIMNAARDHGYPE